MLNFDKIIVVIPSLDPDEKLGCVVNGLISCGFGDIILVNDGSAAENKHFFDELGRLPQCTVLSHLQNKGKGAALKTAFNHILLNRTDYIGVVTADGDNQHHTDDIAAVADLLKEDDSSLILGARDFSLKQIPLRSRVGNRVSSFLFGILCRRHITDTQTGLRAIPKRYLKEVAQLEGERFEYETNMLLALPRLAIPLREVPIKTIYINENATSHFRAIGDSMSIIKLVGAFGLSSICCAAVDIGCYSAVVAALRFMPLRDKTFIATAFARAVSSLLNYIVNRKAVFSAQNSVLRSLKKYYLLCLCQLLCSWIGVWGLATLIGGGSVISKLIVDAILFFISFRIQRNWVFSDKISD